MKKSVFCLLTVCGLACAQGPTFIRLNIPTDNRPISAAEWRLKLVGRLMSLPSPVTNGAIQLHGMGDEAAVDILKLLGEEGSAPTSGEVESALDIIHMAFEHPGSARPADVRPRAALFLLQYLGGTTAGQAAKERITAEVQSFRALDARLTRSSAAPQPK